ncbi:MAG TPA: hypothetical protein VGN16_19900 [Acidobacteriaceae bacterium]|jgi:septal ring factor EnvC (AmiA/AmiB activator)
MWPKAIAQLIELVPHLTRLVPMLDRFFQSRNAGEDSARRAMDAMAEGLRGDLGQVTASHAGLYRQLNEQSEKLSSITVEVRALKSSLGSAEARIDRLDQQISTAQKMLAATLFLNVILVILVAILLVHHR